jgi:hypothetical protein
LLSIFQVFIDFFNFSGQTTPSSNLTTSDWITFIGVLVALGVGIFNLISSLTTNRRTTFVNAVTSERVKWMGQLRELISEYLMLTTYYDKKPVLNGEELTNFLNRIIFLKQRIQLHLNLNGEKDREIISLIDRLNTKYINLYTLNDIYKLPDEKKFNAYKNDMYFNEELKKHFHKSIDDMENSNVNITDEEKYYIIGQQAMTAFYNSLKENFGDAGRDEIIILNEKLSEITSEYLKSEWERVKNEARKGKFKK